MNCAAPLGRGKLRRSDTRLRCALADAATEAHTEMHIAIRTGTDIGAVGAGDPSVLAPLLDTKGRGFDRQRTDAVASHASAPVKDSVCAFERPILFVAAGR